MDDKPWIKASEIGDYVYCHRGWWLRFTGHIFGKTEEMIEGTAEHELIATRLEKNDQGINIAHLIIISSTVLIVIIIAAILVSSLWQFS
jgi:CRISPR/Cas system-associated exonuclease Cas4 (RecB family)